MYSQSLKFYNFSFNEFLEKNVMENIQEKNPPRKIENTENAVSVFLENWARKEDRGKQMVNAVIEYLKENREEIGEFCLQIRDASDKNDKTTPFLVISALVRKLLEEHSG